MILEGSSCYSTQLHQASITHQLQSQSLSHIHGLHCTLLQCRICHHGIHTTQAVHHSMKLCSMILQY